MIHFSHSTYSLKHWIHGNQPISICKGKVYVYCRHVGIEKLSHPFLSMSIDHGRKIVGGLEGTHLHNKWPCWELPVSCQRGRGAAFILRPYTSAYCTQTRHALRLYRPQPYQPACQDFDGSPCRHESFRDSLSSTAEKLVQPVVVSTYAPSVHCEEAPNRVLLPPSFPSSSQSRYQISHIVVQGDLEPGSYLAVRKKASPRTHNHHPLLPSHFSCSE